MGINKLNVCFVVYFDILCNIEFYYQEIGCVGCDGLFVEVMLFYDLVDMVWLCCCLEEKLQGQLQDIECYKFNVMGVFVEV